MRMLWLILMIWATPSLLILAWSLRSDVIDKL